MEAQEARQIIKNSRASFELSRRLSEYMTAGSVYRWIRGDSVAKIYAEKIESVAMPFAEAILSDQVVIPSSGMKATDSSQRLGDILAKYESGMTLQQIGDSLDPKLTRERVRQILKPTDYAKKRRISEKSIAKKSHIAKYRELKNLFALRWNRDEALRITGYNHELTDEQLCCAIYREFHLTRMNRYMICGMCKAPKVPADFPPRAAIGRHRVCHKCEAARMRDYLQRKAAEKGLNVYQYSKQYVKGYMEKKNLAQKNYYQRKALERGETVAKHGSPEYYAKIAASNATTRAAKRAAQI